MFQKAYLPIEVNSCVKSCILVTIRSQIWLTLMQVLTTPSLTGTCPAAGAMGEQALSNIAGLMRGQRIQKKPVALVSVASAATVLMAALGVYLVNVHPHVASWG